MIELDVKSIRELQAGQVVVEILTAEVTSLQLGHGFQSERMLLQVLLSLALIALGVFCASAFLHGSRSKLAAVGSVGVVLGAWVVFRRGPVLRVETKHGTRKLFPPASQLESLRTTVSEFRRPAAHD